MLAQRILSILCCAAAIGFAVHAVVSLAELRLVDTLLGVVLVAMFLRASVGAATAAAVAAGRPS